MLVKYLYILYIYILKKPIKSSLDFALIVFSFLVVGQSYTYNLLCIMKAWHINKITKHSVDFLLKKNLKVVLSRWWIWLYKYLDFMLFNVSFKLHKCILPLFPSLFSPFWNVVYKSCPAHHQKGPLPLCSSHIKYWPAFLFTLMPLLLGTFTLLLASFCMQYVELSLACHLFKCH